MILAKRDGRMVYHWPASIEELIKAKKEASKSIDSGDFSDGKLDSYYQLKVEAEQAAGAWQLCACGSLCDAIPRVKTRSFYRGLDSSRIKNGRLQNGVQPIKKRECPLDDKLYELGFDFSYYIRNEEYSAAKKTLEKIEKRAAVVLAEIGKKLKKYQKPIK